MKLRLMKFAQALEHIRSSTHRVPDLNTDIPEPCSILQTKRLPEVLSRGCPPIRRHSFDRRQCFSAALVYSPPDITSTGQKNALAWAGHIMQLEPKGRSSPCDATHRAPGSFFRMAMVKFFAEMSASRTVTPQAGNSPNHRGKRFPRTGKWIAAVVLGLPRTDFTVVTGGNTKTQSDIAFDRGCLNSPRLDDPFASAARHISQTSCII